MKSQSINSQANTVKLQNFADISKYNTIKITLILSLFEWLLIRVKFVFKRSKEQEKKGSEKREVMLVSF